jgi:hypothetical protein
VTTEVVQTPGTQTPEAPARKKTPGRKLALRIGAAVAGVVVLLIVLAFAGHKAADAKNFHNPAVLARSIKTTAQARLSDPSSAAYSPGVTITSVTCIPDTGQNTDTCLLKASDGSSGTATAVIAADGLSWITK